MSVLCGGADEKKIDTDREKIVMTENTEEINKGSDGSQTPEGDVKVNVKNVKQHGAFYNALDKFFGFSERGTNILKEVFAGILLFFEMAFFLYVNALMLSDSFSGVTSYNMLPVNSLYFIMTLVSCVSTIAIGLLCNAPFVQAGSLGVSMLMVSIVGQYAGFTYANIMAISLVANLVYLVVMVIKPVRKFIFDAVPEQIRRALPAAMGIFLIVYVLVQLNVLSFTTYNFASIFSTIQGTGGAEIGYFGITGLTLSVDTLEANSFFVVMPIITAVIGFVLLLILQRFRVKHATIISFGGTFVIYILMYYFLRLSPVGLTDYKLFSFIVPSYGEISYYNSTVDAMMMVANSNYFWQAFTSGFDFTAFIEAGGTTAEVAGIFITCALSFLLLGAAETGTAVNACGYINGGLDEKGNSIYLAQPLFRKVGDYVNVYSVNALCSALGCAMGAGPVVVRAENAVGAHEGGKTGLTAIVAGLLLIIPMFTIAVAGVFMNGNVIYGLMIFVGLALLTSLKKCDFSSVISIIPFMLTVLVTAFTLNLGTAIMAGVIMDTLLKALTFKFRQISIGTWVLTAVMIVILVLQLCI